MAAGRAASPWEAASGTAEGGGGAGEGAELGSLCSEKNLGLGWGSEEEWGSHASGWPKSPIGRAPAAGRTPELTVWQGGFSGSLSLDSSANPVRSAFSLSLAVPRSLCCFSPPQRESYPSLRARCPHCLLALEPLVGECGSVEAFPPPPSACSPLCPTGLDWRFPEQRPLREPPHQGQCPLDRIQHRPGR